MGKASWNKWLAAGLMGALRPCGAIKWSGPQFRRLLSGSRRAGGGSRWRLSDSPGGSAGAGDAADKDPLPVSDYWIGIAPGRLPEMARLQLGLEHGLVVADVMADSPAAKAKFKANDILIKAGDAKLQAAADLIKAVDAAQEKELAIVIVRGGKEQTLKVTPIKRPKSRLRSRRAGTRCGCPRTCRRTIENLKEALSKLKDKTGSRAAGIMLARPAVVPPHARPTSTSSGTRSLPKNVTISITKKGDEPAKIHVEKDGRTWDVTERQAGRVARGRAAARPAVPRPPAVAEAAGHGGWCCH